MLPRGTEDGLEYQFFFIVTTTLDGKDVQEQVPFKYPIGYPFDRPVYWEHIFHELPNTYFHDVKIFFKDTEHHESSVYGKIFDDKHVPMDYHNGQDAKSPIYKNVIKQFPIHHYDDIHH